MDDFVFLGNPRIVILELGNDREKKIIYLGSIFRSRGKKKDFSKINVSM